LRIPKRKQLQTVIILFFALITTGLIFFGFFKFVYKAEELNNGEAYITNLTNNGDNVAYQGSTKENPQIPKYNKFELTFDINWYHNRDFTNPQAKYDPIIEGTANPYWPYDQTPAANTVSHPNAVPDGIGVSVDGLFLPSSQTDWSKATVQPGFYYQDFEKQDYLKDKNQDWIYPKGSPVWKIRYSPKDLGQYQYKIRVTDKTGQIHYTPQANTLTAIDSSNPGFVQVSKTDSRYFETSNGQNLNLIGISDPGINSTYDIEKNLAQINEMGINLIRPWWQGSSFRPILFGISGQGGVPDWGFTLNANQIGSGNNQTMPGEIFSYKMTKSYPSARTGVPIKTNTNYRLSAWVKTTGVTGTGTYGASLYPYPPKTGGSQPVYRSEYVTGDTDWKQLVVDFTSDATSKNIDINLNLANIVTGEAYFTKLSLKENLGNDKFGGEIINRPNINVQNYISLQHAWYADYLVEEAAKNNIYMKVVAEEKQDMVFSRIGADGTAASPSDDNVYASSTSANRVYQTYYWRYLTARYSYSTTIHSWELFNEGNPYSGGHRDDTLALGSYISQYDPNKHLTSTSNWHSYPISLWDKIETSYGDLHRYIGSGAYSDRYILWPGWDGAWYDPPKISALKENYSFDETIAHSGHNSLKITIPPATKDGSVKDSGLFVQIGVKPKHQYEISWWTKAENIKQAGGVCEPTSPFVSVYYSGEQTMWDGWPSWNVTGGNPCGKWKIPDGTYDWQKITTQQFTIPETGRDTKLPPRYLGISFNYYTKTSVPEGIAWFDDLQVKDITTGEVYNYNGGFENITHEEDDVVAAHQSYSQIIKSFDMGKPSIRGEVGFQNPRPELSNPYKGYTSGQVFDRLRVDDTQGVWWRKWTWANLDSGGLTEILWDSMSLLMNRNYKFAKAYQNFMSDISLSNGKYKDLNASTSDSKLRVLGQKELADGIIDKAHLWIDNAPYTWKNVVDASAGSSQLASPISGNITISDAQPSKTYLLQWWSTSTIDNPSTSDINEQIVIDNTYPTLINSDEQGKLTIPINNLQSDIALKITIEKTKTIPPEPSPTPTSTPVDKTTSTPTPTTSLQEVTPTPTSITPTPSSTEENNTNIDNNIPSTEAPSQITENGQPTPISDTTNNNIPEPDSSTKIFSSPSSQPLPQESSVSKTESPKPTLIQGVSSRLKWLIAIISSIIIGSFWATIFILEKKRSKKTQD